MDTKKGSNKNNNIVKHIPRMDTDVKQLSFEIWSDVSLTLKQDHSQNGEQCKMSLDLFLVDKKGLK